MSRETATRRRVLGLVVLAVSCIGSVPFLWLQFGYTEEWRVSEEHFFMHRVISRNRLTGARVFNLYDSDGTRVFRGREGARYSVVERFFDLDGALTVWMRRSANTRRWEADGSGTGRDVFHGEYELVDEDDRVVLSLQFDHASLKARPFGRLYPPGYFEGVVGEHGKEGVWSYWSDEGHKVFQHRYVNGELVDIRVERPWWIAMGGTIIPNGLRLPEESP